ncbi:MAG: KTSC domain-containing protein [Myxococcales bacterium]
MERVSLVSGVLVSAGYDASARELELEFQGGRIYRYSEVPPGVFEFLLRTKHKGSYVNRMIQGQYSYREVTPEPPEQDLLAALHASILSSPAQEPASTKPRRD